MHSRLPNSRRLSSKASVAAILAAACSITYASAQTPSAATPDTRPVKTFYLNGGTSPEQSNEVFTGVRQLLEPQAKVYLDLARSAILVRGTPAQIDLAGKLIADMDQPQKDYKLTYTLTEMDGSKRVGVQHYTLTMFAGTHNNLKQGSKVPVATGTVAAEGSNSSSTQFTFIDVGINLDATLSPAADGVRLLSKIEDSGLLEDKTIAGVNEPIIRQTVLQGTSLLQPGKPLALGSLDVPGSTRHLDVEVLLTPLP